MTAPEVAKQAGVSYRRLDYWIRAGLIPGVAEATPGSGHPRAMTRTQATHVVTMAALIRAGFTPGVASTVAARGDGVHELAPGIRVMVGAPHCWAAEYPASERPVDVLGPLLDRLHAQVLGLAAALIGGPA